MHIDYTDITSRVSEPPLWWLNGVPRYDRFWPGMTGGNEAVLVEAKCQHCGKPFVIGRSTWTSSGDALRREIVETRTINLGDPPWHCCPGPGDTMTTVPLEVFEFWMKVPGTADYERVPELEIVIDDPFGKMR